MIQKRLDVPFALQDPWYFCGPTALSLVAKFKGIECSPAELAQIMGTTEAIGTACAAMSAGARSLGLWVYETWNGELEDIRALIDSDVAPIIYVYERESVDHGFGALDHYHFYIVTGYSNESFFVHDTDPQIDGGSEHRRMSESDLFSCWRAEPNVEGRWMLGVSTRTHDERWLGPHFTGTPIAV